MDVAIDLVKPSPYQPRLSFQVDDLKEEIERDGLLSALVVRKRDEYYELLDGERRLRALKQLGWKRVPIDVRDVDDTVARRSVFKLNSIRENYTTEEKARYFKKLHDEEGLKFYEIGKELNIDDNWILAHLNVFELPEGLQKAVWVNAKGASIAHIQDLEPVIGANIDEATKILREDIERGLTRDEARKVLRPQLEEIEKARVEAAQKALTEKLGVRTPIQLRTPQDYDKAAEALKREAQRQREEAMTSEEKAAQEAERKAKLEAQAAAKAQREEEKRQQKAEEERRRQERAEKQARAELKGDKTFIHDALKALSQEERLEILGMAPVPEKPKEPKVLREQFQEVIKDASQLVNKIERLRENPGFHELDLKAFALDLYMLVDAFTELTQQIGGGHE